MNTIEIGKYIKTKRIEKHLTQKDLAEILQISFQAVSKWETGTTLPDTSILLTLSDVLEVTVDQILNAGEFRKRMNKKINIEEIQESFNSLLKMKEVLGPNNGIYKSLMSGVMKDEHASFEDDLRNPEKMEILVAKSVVQLIIDGYQVSKEEIDNFFSTEEIREKVKKYQIKYNQ